MKGLALRILAALALCAGAGATQAALFKCTNAEGHTVFSQTPCAQIGAGDQVRMRKPDSRPMYSEGAREGKSATEQLEEMRRIRGPRAADLPPAMPSASNRDRCPQISEIQRRNMIVGDQMFKCMTKREVRDVIGRAPDHVLTDSDGWESWHYYGANGVMVDVYFDGKGLVRSWSGWR